MSPFEVLNSTISTSLQSGSLRTISAALDKYSTYGLYLSLTYSGVIACSAIGAIEYLYLPDFL